MGKATALLLAEAGVQKLCLVDVNEEGLLATGNETAVEQVFDEVKKKFQRLDYAVNAAGVNGRTFGTLEQVTQDDWDWVTNVNQRSVAVLCRQQIRLMLQNERKGTDQIGSIVNFGSWACWHGHEFTPHYTASKHAVLGLTKCLCIQHAGQGLRINGVAPGVTDTPMFKPEYRDAYNLRMIPQGRIGQPREIAEVVLFLCSPRSSFINGTMIPVDGGMDAK